MKGVSWYRERCDNYDDTALGSFVAVDEAATIITYVIRISSRSPTPRGSLRFHPNVQDRLS